MSEIKNKSIRAVEFLQSLRMGNDDASITFCDGDITIMISVGSSWRDGLSVGFIDGAHECRARTDALRQIILGWQGWKNE